MVSEKSGKKASSGKRIFLKIGCGFFLLLCVFVIAVYVAGDSMLRATAEKFASEEIGIPVKIGNLRLSLVGRPSVSLHKVKIGSTSLASFEQITVTVNSIATLTGAESVIVNVDCGGVEIDIPDNPGSKGTEFYTLLTSLSSGSDDSSGKWAFPVFKVRAFNLNMPAGKGRRSKISFDAFEVSDLSSQSLQNEFPQMGFSLRNVGITIDEKQIFKVDDLSGSAENSKDRVSLKSLSIGKLEYSDSFDLSGDLALQGLADTLQQLPLQKQSAESASPVVIEKVNFKSLAVDLSGNSTAGKDVFKVDAENLFVDRIAQEKEFSSLKGLQASRFRFSGVAGGKKTGFDIQGLALTAEKKSSQSIIPALSCSFEEFAFTAGESQALADIEISGASLVLPEHAAGLRDIFVEKLKSSKLRLNFPVRENKGLPASSYIDEYLSYLQQNYLKGEVGASSQVSEKTGAVKVASLALSDISLNITEADRLKLQSLFAVSLREIIAKDLRYDSNSGSVTSPAVEASGFNFESQIRDRKLACAFDSVAAFDLDQQSALLADRLEVKGFSCREILKNKMQDEIKLSSLSMRVGSAELKDGIDFVKFNNLSGTLSVMKNKGFVITDLLSAVKQRVFACSGIKEKTAPDNVAGNTVKINDLDGSNIRLKIRNTESGKNHAVAELLLAGIKAIDISNSPDINKVASVRAENCSLNFYNTRKEGARFAFSKLRAADIVYPLHKENNAKTDLRVSGFNYRRSGTSQKDFLSAGDISLVCTSLSPLILSRVEFEKLKSNLSFYPAGSWDIEENLKVVSETAETLASAFPQDENNEDDKPFSVQTKNFICKSASIKLSAETPEGLNEMNVSPGEFTISNFILLEHEKLSRIYFGEVRSRLAHTEFVSSTGNYYLSSENILLSQYDSYRLDKGTAAVNLTLQGVKFSKAKKGTVPQILALNDTLELALQEDSVNRTAVKHLRIRKPRIMTEIFKGNEIKFSTALSDVEQILVSFMPAGEIKQSSAKQSEPILISEFLLSDGIVNVRKLPENKNDYDLNYKLSSISVVGNRLAEYINTSGSLTVDGVLSCEEISKRTSKIKVDVKNIAMPHGFYKADFVLAAVAEKLPVELLADEAEDNGVILSGKDGYIEFSMKGNSQRGRLDIYGDLLLDKVKVKINPKNRKKRGNIGDVFSALIVTAKTIMPAVSLNDKVIEKILYIVGTLEKPELKFNSNKVWDNILNILKIQMKKNQNKDIPTDKTGQEPVDEDKEPARKSGNPLLDILGKGGILPGTKDQQPEDEKEDPDNEPTKEERRINRIKSAIDIFQGIMKKD